MAISNTLLKEFAEITNDSEEETTNNELRATVKSTGDGVVYVQIDGNADSDGLTPASTTTNLAVGDRVYVTIQNHSAVVTGNITDPSATNTNLTDAVNNVSTKFEVLEDKITSEVKKLDDSMSTKIEQTEKSITAVSKKVEDNTTSISTLKQTADGLSSEVSKKVGEDEIISKINQSAEAVTIKASKINLDGTTSAGYYGSNLCHVEITQGLVLFYDGDGNESGRMGNSSGSGYGCYIGGDTLCIDGSATVGGYRVITTDNISSYIPDIPDTSSFVTSSDLSSKVSDIQTWTNTRLDAKTDAIKEWVGNNFQAKSSSDARLKQDVYELNDVSDFYMDLSPVHFNYCNNVDGLDSRDHYGFVAQDVLAVQNYHGISDFDFVEKIPTPKEGGYENYISDDEMYIVHYNELHALHVQMIQKQQKTIEALTARIEALEAKLNEKE